MQSCAMGSRLFAGPFVARTLAQCSNGRLQPVCAIVFGSYDETSMETRAVFGCVKEPAMHLPFVGGARAERAEQLQRAERAADECKLWQSVFCVAFCSGLRKLAAYFCCGAR